MPLLRYNSPSDIRTVRGRGGPDYPKIRTTEGKLRGISNIQKSCLIAKLKLIKLEILCLTVYNNDNTNNNNLL